MTTIDKPLGVYANAQATMEPIRGEYGRIEGYERVPCLSLPFTAYDKHGRTERVGEERAQEIEAQLAKKAEG